MNLSHEQARESARISRERLLLRACSLGRIIAKSGVPACDVHQYLDAVQSSYDDTISDLQAKARRRAAKEGR